MSKILDKITSALGFSKNYDDEYEEYDEYDQYDEYDEEEPVKENRASRFSFSGRSFGSSRAESRYDEPEYESDRYEEPSYKQSDYTRNSYSGASTASSSYTRSRNSKVVNLNANVQMKVVVSSPESIEEAKEIAQSLKEKKPVVINLEFVDQPIAQRITDFLCGSCYALNGNIQRIADKIFMIAPDNVDFAGDVDISSKLKEDGLAFTWQED